jgi:hypothetical protein
LGIDVPSPEIEGGRLRVDQFAYGIDEEGVRVSEVAHEKIESVVVVARVDRLRKVDDRDGVVPEEHVVWREVRVDAVVR